MTNVYTAISRNCDGWVYTTLEERKVSSIEMKLLLDFKEKNVDMLFGTTIEAGYRDGANLRLQVVKLVQQILDIWSFYRKTAAEM